MPFDRLRAWRGRQRAVVPEVSELAGRVAACVEPNFGADGLARGRSRIENRLHHRAGLAQCEQLAHYRQLSIGIRVDQVQLRREAHTVYKMLRG